MNKKREKKNEKEEEKNLIFLKKIFNYIKQYLILF
jgi:hypothetical protein